MNILHVVRPAEGGMKNHVLSLIKYLDKTKYHFFLACPQAAEWGPLLSDTGVELEELPLKGELSLWSDLSSIIRLGQLIKSRNIQLVHTHGMKAGLVGRIAGYFAKTKEYPYIVTTVHNSIYQYHLPSYQKRCLSSVQKLLARHTDQFITVSQALKKEIMQWEGINEDQIRVIYNGITADSFNKKASTFIKLRLGLDPLAPVVGTVARLAPQKGVEFFIRAASLISQVIGSVQFLVVGDGPLKKNLLHQTEKLGLKDKVIFTGQLPDTSEIYPLLDVFVLPSLSEGLPITILEAMAAQRPIVATAAGGIPELISHQYTGFLVPPGNEQALAHGILELLKRPKWAERLAAAARQRAVNQFSLGKMIAQTDDLYRQIAQGHEISEVPRRYAHA